MRCHSGQNHNCNAATRNAHFELYICRNPLLQKLFMFLGNGEKAGSGADIIKKGCTDNKWPQPVLSERTQPDECLMTFALAVEEDGVGNNVGKEQNDPKELTERQVYILGLIEEDDLITIQQMTQKMKVPEKTIKRELAALQEMGVLVREDGRKGGRWIIIQLTK